MTPEEFERLCLEKYLEFMHLKRSDVQVIYRKIHPIDIIVIENTSSDPTPASSKRLNYRAPKSKKVHFIECKYYKDELDLDTVSKAFVVSFCEDADTLTIATTKGLSQQAREYACKFFSGKLRDSIDIIEWHPLSNKLFDASIDDNETEMFIEATRPYNIISLEMYVQNPVKDEYLNGNGQRFLKPTEKIAIRLLLDNPARHRNIQIVKATFKSEHGDVQDVVLEFSGTFHKHSKYMGSFFAFSLIESEVYHLSSIVISSSSGSDVRLFSEERFVSLVRNPKDIVLPNLRQEESLQLIQWLNVQDSKILMLHGEGGVGKTYLSSEICHEALNQGYIIGHEVLAFESTPSLIANMLWIFFGSDLSQFSEKNENKQISLKIITDFIDHFMSIEGTLSPSGISGLKTLLLEGRIIDNSGDVLITNFIRLLLAINKPLVFLISNAHKINRTVSDCLKLILQSLESCGWGRVKIIVESRDTQEDISPEWISLQNWMRNNLENKIYDYHVVPLNNSEILNVLEKHFDKVLSFSFSRIFNRIGGGNPLFLTQLLKTLSENEIITLRAVGSFANGMKTFSA